MLLKTFLNLKNLSSKKTARFLFAGACDSYVSYVPCVASVPYVSSVTFLTFLTLAGKPALVATTAFYMPTPSYLDCIVGLNDVLVLIQP